MSGESVSIREFELWVKQQADTQNKHSEHFQQIYTELRNMNAQMNETNVLLREDAAINKNLIENHIKTSSIEQRRTYDTFEIMKGRFTSIEETLKDQAGVYHSAQLIRWVLGLVLAGSITALGVALGGYVNFGKVNQVAQEKVVIPKEQIIKVKIHEQPKR